MQRVTRRWVILLAAVAAAAAPSRRGRAGALEGSERDRLFAALKEARSEAEARGIEAAIWQMWMAQGPSIAVRRDMAAAMQARLDHDYDQALTLLDGIVDDAPGYAEGWNQRAFVRFLRGDPYGALADIDTALGHGAEAFRGAVAKGMILMQLGRIELARKALKEAVEIDPWLPARSMIVPDPAHPPPAPGDRGI